MTFSEGNLSEFISVLPLCSAEYDRQHAYHQYELQHPRHPSKYRQLRPRQRKSVLHGRCNRSIPSALSGRVSPAAPPDFAIGEHRQRWVHHGVAVTDAPCAAFCRHLEGVAPFEFAIDRTPGACGHFHDVAAEHVLRVNREELAADVLRGRLEAGGPSSAPSPRSRPTARRVGGGWTFERSCRDSFAPSSAIDHPRCIWRNAPFQKIRLE